MPQELLHLNTRRIVIRVLLLGLLIAATVWSYFVVRWYIGNTLAEYFDSTGNNLQVAEMAASLAPDDPLTHWRLAQVTLKNLPLDQQAQAIAQFEKAVSLSPNDYRFWMALGTASEQAGDSVKAEQALKRAVELAPSYSYPRWYLGNLLLRSGRYDEAFAELRRASEADAELQPQQFNLIWEVYKTDSEALTTAVGDNPAVRAKFSLYLLGRQEFEPGLRMWDTLNPAEKKSNRETGEAIVGNLLTVFRYHDAVGVWNDLAADTNTRAEIGNVFDGGFELGPEMPFSWQVQPVPNVQIGLDPSLSYSGGSSLRLIFNVRTNIENINIAQLVPVATNTAYDVEFYVRSEKLETGGPPVVQIVDPTTSGVIVTSPLAATGDSDWKKVALSFTTGDNTEAVLIKIERP
ncbi:MAG TPA: tetratricopeptide repeat protein, partial [Pyrinomonadaceae bacterium]|nr:tetratricopeptide repeat protein [Pyrinomonadaceae bacterium]